MGFDAAKYCSERNMAISNEALDLTNRLRDVLIAEGLGAGADHYPRALIQFFHWVEASGHSLNSMPPTAVEDYIAATMADKAPATRDATRQYLKSSTNRITAEFGLNLSHLGFHAKETPNLTSKEKKARKLAKADGQIEKNVQNRISALSALPEGQRVRNVITGVKAVDIAGLNYQPPSSVEIQEEAETPSDFQQIEDSNFDLAGRHPDPFSTISSSSEIPMSEVQQPVQQQPQVIVLQSPQQRQAPRQVAVGTAAMPATAGAIALTVAGVPFRGPFVSIYQVMDGTTVGTMVGQEILVEQAVTKAIAQYGSAEAYLQRVVLPRLRNKLPQGTSVISFVLVELNAAKQPTNSRAEVTIGVVDASVMPMLNGVASQPNQAYMPAFDGFPQMQQPTIEAKAAETFLSRLSADAEAARVREDKARSEMMAAKDQQSLAALQESARRENDIRRDTERQMNEFRLQIEKATMAPAFTPIQQPFTPPPIQHMEPQINMGDIIRANAEAAAAANKAAADTQAALISAFTSKAPAAPVADPMAAMTPFFAMMQTQATKSAEMQMQMQMENQRQLAAMQAAAQQQQQASSAAAAAAADASMKMIVGFLTQKPVESEFDKMMKQAMYKKLTDDEGGMEKTIEKIAQFRQAAEVMGLGGGGQTSWISELMANGGPLLGGVAKLMSAAAKSSVAPVAAAPKPHQPAPQPQQRALPAAPKVDVVVKPVVETALAEAPSIEAISAVETPAVETPVINTAMAVSEMVRDSALAMLNAAKLEEDEDFELFTEALTNYVVALATSGDEGERQVTLLREELLKASGYEDIYLTAKFALVFGGLKAPRVDIAAVADVIHQNYAKIVEELGGDATRVLEDADRWVDEEEVISEAVEAEATV